jgi:hypothetical protein
MLPSCCVHRAMCCRTAKAATLLTAADHHTPERSYLPALPRDKRTVAAFRGTLAYTLKPM